MKRNHNSITRLLTAVLMLFMVSALLIAQTPTEIPMELLKMM